jgi:ankyrin repeat protein
VHAIIKLNITLREKNLELFDVNAFGGVHAWTGLHLASHGGYLTIVRELLKAGADIFLRNSNN